MARANPRTASAARALIELIRDSSAHSLILSPFLLAELERVLNYPRLQALWPLTRTEIAAYIQALQDFGECVFPDSPQAVIASDPADDPVIATAVAGKVRVRCALNRHFASEPVVEYARAHGIELMNDVELLCRLRSRDAEIQ